ncbi:hypothetical protein WMY93_000367 [Mugilogobius chulae]|uniref:Presequence protease, mitochondrial n=1 Tax=Mugilogobius chulae TaxID=88201 RepID=A0AAW0Q4U8_9GOBI
MWRQTKTALNKVLRLKNLHRHNSRVLNSSSAPERALQFEPGQKIHGFTVKQVVAVPDLFLTAVKLTHDQTGAQYLHAARDDSNNLFSVQLRTTPMDSSGVPHILEHTVLCGSHKFPVRDPFFKMLNRSLSTFMNAFTASDYTMYPFSTQNSKDFQNLLSVYLDAVFFPCLREQDFCRTTSGFTLSTFRTNCFQITLTLWCRRRTIVIPDLTWDQLKQFHATPTYPPSNARFFTYGDLPLEQHLQQIQQEALCKFERIDPKTEVPPQPTGPNLITDTFEGFTLSLLSSLMVSGPNSPFYKALIEPKIGTDFSSVVGYDGSTRDASFSIGLQGTSEQDVEKVKQIINSTIDQIIQDGFEEERIEALLHKIEIQMKHQSTNFGLSLASFVASSWNHDGDPVELLQIGDNVSKFKQALKENPRFLQDKVQQYFKDGLWLDGLPQQAQQMELRTGGMSVSPQVIPDSAHLDVYEQGVALSSSCLDRNLPHMFDLWRELFNSAQFNDEERLRVLVMMSAQELTNGISYSGHMYAMTRAARHLTSAGELQETFGGMEQVKFMKRVAEIQDLNHVMRTLPRLKKHLLNPHNMRCAINATPQKMSDASKHLETFLSEVSGNKKDRKPVRPNTVQKPIDPGLESGPTKALVSDSRFQPCHMKTFFQMPFPVNFVSQSIRTVPFTHEDYASLCVLARMMTAKFLHGEIREKGGAYGGGARMGGGLFTFYSYSTPFPQSADWARAGQFSQQDIDEAKLSVFSAVDAPVAPSDKGIWGVGRATDGAAILGPENDVIRKDPSWIVK